MRALHLPRPGAVLSATIELEMAKAPAGELHPGSTPTRQLRCQDHCQRDLDCATQQRGAANTDLPAQGRTRDTTPTQTSGARRRDSSSSCTRVTTSHRPETGYPGRCSLRRAVSRSARADRGWCAMRPARSCAARSVRSRISTMSARHPP
jgi:hypothetical protein